MFHGCSSLTSLDLRHFNTSNVTNMTGMFCNCSSLTCLDLSNFNTSNVTNMNYYYKQEDIFIGMFSGCNSLVKLDLRNFNTEKVTNFHDMFAYCTNLTEINLSSFNTTNAYSMNGMFKYCKKLQKLDLSNFNAGNASTQTMFEGCSSLTELELYSLRCIGSEMFLNCSNLEVVYIGKEIQMCAYNMDAFKGTDKLHGCLFDKLTYVNGGKAYATFNDGTLSFDVTRCDDAIPADAYPLGPEIPGWTDKALKIEKVVFPKYFKYVHPTTLYGWFFNCRNLTEIEGLEYLNTEDVENMSLMFAGCKNLTTLDLSNFNTQNVTNMKGMFGYYDKEEDKGYYCSNLETIFVGDDWTTKYTEDDNLFEGCTKLTGGLGSTYDAKKISTEYAHADGGKTSPGYLTYKPDEAHKTVSAIAMNALPKTEYIQGEPLSTTGGTLKVDYNNMTSDIIDLGMAEITGFDTEKVGNQVLVVTYYDKKTTYEVNVKAKTITKLEVTTLPKTEYGIGEKLNLDGGILTVSYSNNLTETVALSQAKVSGYDPMKLGTQKLGVIYLQHETSFEVSVIEKPAKSIAVSTLPKSVYVEGDSFSADGGVITITYDGGATGESDLKNAELTGYDPNKLGEQTITVKYLGCTTTYKVTVKELAYYNVTYKVDGEIYGEVERVKLGATITQREAPTKEGYTFSGWSEIPANMPEHDIEIVGTFAKNDNPDDPTTPTSELTVNADVRIWSYDRTIVVENGGSEIRIIDTNGRLVKTVNSTADRTEIPMQKSGIYIVKTAAKTQKVMIQ